MFPNLSVINFQCRKCRLTTRSSGRNLPWANSGRLARTFGHERNKMKTNKSSKNKAVIRNYIRNVVNTGNIDKIDKYISEKYTEVLDGKRYKVGIDGAKKHIIDVRQTYQDLKLTVDHQIAEGDWVATSITASGTHKGEWIGMKPTGKKVVFTGVNVERLEKGKIVEHGGAANLLFQFLEIGAIQVVNK